MKILMNGYLSALLIVFLYMFTLLAGASVSMCEELHPFILFTASDIPLVQSHLDTEPYVSWFRDENIEANRILSLNVAWDESSVAPETKAYYAKVLAFSWAFSDSTTVNRRDWEKEAILSLYHMPSSNYGSSYSSDLMVAEAALFWAEAYDILKGGGSSFSIDGYADVEAIIRSKLTSLRDYMARDSYELFPSSPRIGNDFPSVVWVDALYSDNHHVKLNAALAAMSLVIADEAGFRDDLDHALNRLRGSLHNLTITGDGSETAGGWAEGPSYLRYSVHQYFAAISALRNAGEADLYDEIPELVTTHLQLPYIVMPDGYMPPWDDNPAVIFDLAGLLWSYHSDSQGRDMLYWMWQSAGSPVPKAFRADYISSYDDTSPVYGSPETFGLNPSGLYAESGFARFRNSWDTDSIYLLLQSEYGEAHTNGQAHEHPDQNSFILHAFGEMLILDSGYGGWDKRDLTKYAENHNLILVNGEGPPGSSQPLGIGPWTIEGDGAYIENGFTSPLIDYAVSQATYEDAVFTRHVVFPDHRYFLLFDTIESANSAEFTLLLHGNGGGTSGGTFVSTDSGALWHHNQASVEAFVVGSSNDISFSTENMYHATYSQSPMQTHTVLKASQQGTARSYLTMLYPYPDNETAPEISVATVENGNGIHLSSPDINAYAANRVGWNDVVITDNGDTILQSDGIFVWCDTGGGDTPKTMFMEDGRFLTDNAGTIVSVSTRVNLSYDRTQEYHIEGWLQADELTEITFHNLVAETISFNSSPVPFDVQDGNTIVSLNGEGAYQLSLPVPDVELVVPHSDENWNVLENHEITWSSQNVLAVNLEYSLDNGLTWNTIVDSVSADTGRYSWTVPDTTSSHCLVRISSSDDGLINDLNDGTFTIYLPTITLASPNGGEKWTASSQESISWTSEFVDTVKLEYSLDGGSWELFAESIPAVDGTYEVTVPDTVSTECIVRITDTANSSITDQSGAVFSIHAPITKSITVLNPNGGEEWESGTQQDIVWEWSHIWDADITYSIDNGLNWTNITDVDIVFIKEPENPSQYSYTWTIPDSASTTCLIRIQGISDTSVIDQSDSVFTITSNNPNMVASEPDQFLTVSSYPNPFNLRTTLSYRLPQQAEVIIFLYNAMGQKVRELYEGTMEQGRHERVIDASELTSGLYFYCVQTGYDAVNGKILLIK